MVLYQKVALTLATYNVLDLFGDDDAYVAGKARALGPIVQGLGADVIGFQEIASERALAALLEAGGVTGATVVFGTRDARGIGCALVSRLPVIGSEVLTSEALPFPVFVRGDPPPYAARIPLRRGFVSALIDAGELGRVRVFVAHLKSGRGVPMRDEAGEPVWAETQADFAEGDIRALAWRAAEALFLRRAVDRVFASGEADHVAVLGDLNDVFQSLPVRLLSGRGDHALRSVASTIPEQARFSTLHHGRAEAIDHVLVSRSLAAQLDHARFDNEHLRDLSELPADAPRPHESDHAPLVARFVRRDPA